MPVPLTAFVVSPIDARPIQNEREAEDAFLYVGVDLDKAFSVNGKPQLDRVVRFVYRFS